MAGEQTGMSFWNELLLQPQLSPAEKDLRDRFVMQYLIDYDAYAAALRVGFLKSIAFTYAQELLEDPYVRRELARLEREAVAEAPPEKAQANEQSQLKAWYRREANYRGPGASHSARVSAINSLAKIAKMLDDEGDTAARDNDLIKAFREMATKMPV